MGKLKKQRQKFHISNTIQEKGSYEAKNAVEVLPINTPKQDLFAGLSIDITNIKCTLSDDQSVKSHKSVTAQKVISKKNKMKIRKKLLLQKIDSVNQIKKVRKLREKRKNNVVIGDTNPLHDALPSLETLIKNRPNIKYCIPAQATTKNCITRAHQRKKNFVQNVNIFKQTLKKSNFKEDPFKVISHHVKHIIEQERNFISHNGK